jgi:hypothetical protein
MSFMKIGTENAVLFLWAYINLIYAGAAKLHDILQLKFASARGGARSLSVPLAVLFSY